MSAEIKMEDFNAIVGESVELSVNGVNLPATVSEVMPMTKHGDAERTPFSVLFITKQTEPLEQQIFSLQHAGLGQMDVFLVPLGPKGDGMSYEAVFT